MFFDGTFWSADELPGLGLGTKRAEDMAHWPVGGAAGSLAMLAALPTRRKILTHVNNTNPILDEDSDERATLTGARIEVDVAPGVARARALFASASPHLVVSDIGMPQVDGFVITLWKDIPYTAALLCVATYHDFARNMWGRPLVRQLGHRRRRRDRVDAADLVEAVGDRRRGLVTVDRGACHSSSGIISIECTGHCS